MFCSWYFTVVYFPGFFTGVVWLVQPCLLGSNRKMITMRVAVVSRGVCAGLLSSSFRKSGGLAAPEAGGDVEAISSRNKTQQAAKRSCFLKTAVVLSV